MLGVAWKEVGNAKKKREGERRVCMVEGMSKKVKGSW